MIRVKICGLTNIEDALAAVAAGADALGFVFAPSPRRIMPTVARAIIRELPPFVSTVGVFVDAPEDEVRAVREECGLTWVQLHGQEHEETVTSLGPRVIKALRIRTDRDLDPTVSRSVYPGAALLLDTWSPNQAGGTGRTFDWSLAVAPAKLRPIILAGGLTPENVAAAVQIVNPFAVDVSSGVESSPGRKDHERLRLFIHRAKARS